MATSIPYTQPAAHLNPVTTQLPSPSTASTSAYRTGPAFLEAAALLSLWSLSVIIEGGVRFNGSNPSEEGDIFGLSTTVLTVMGLFEVIFGLLGLFIGLGAIVFRMYSTRLLKISMGIQAVLGIMVFVTFVIVVPSYIASGTDSTLAKGLIVIGIFTSMSFCLALQGGQFLFMARLASAAEDSDFLMCKSGNRLRSVLWHTNMTVAGFFTFVMGCVLISKDEGFYMFAPHIGNIPEYTLFSGILMLVWAPLGIILTVTNVQINHTFYYIGSVVVFLNTYLNFTLVQFGNAGVSGEGGGIAMHTGLVLFLNFLGPYFLYQSTKSKEEM